MPVQRRWLVIEAFDWSPCPNVVIRYLAGQIAPGLTRACRASAGARIVELTGEPPLP